MKIYKFIIVLLVINCIDNVLGQSKCDGDMNYLPLDLIQPFGLTTKSYNLEWADGFPNVNVKVVGNSNPLIVGSNHPKESFVGDDFFNYTGYQDIKTLMHYACGSQSSTVEFDLDSGYSQRGIVMIVFGMLPSTKLTIESATVDGPIHETDIWDPVMKGVLQHTDKSHSPSNIETKAGGLGLGVTGLDIHLSLDSTTTYNIFEPPVNASIAHIKLSLVNECNPPDCRGTVLFYSLIAVKDCQLYTVTHPPRNRARPNDLREQHNIRRRYQEQRSQPDQTD